MNPLGDIYMFCACAGFLYVIGTAMLGFANAQGDGGSADAGSADAGGDIGSADGGDFGSADGGGDFGSGDAGDVGSADAGEFGSGDAGDVGSADAGDAGDFSSADVVNGVTRTNLAHARTASTRTKRISIGLLLLKVTSPSTLAMFAFFFGLTGLICAKYLPIVGSFSLIPATILGVIGYNAMSSFTNLLGERLYASSNYKEEQLIGRVAEVTVPIGAGRVGEIIYLNGKVRATASAIATDKEATLAKASKVMITDLRDGVFVVEACTDSVLDDSIMIEEQKLRNS